MISVAEEFAFVIHVNKLNALYSEDNNNILYIYY